MSEYGHDRPIRGKMVFDDGSELPFTKARYVDGKERELLYFVSDGTLYLPEGRGPKDGGRMVMGDESESEVLRRMLENCGVEYETNDAGGARETSWNGFTAFQLTPQANLLMAVTPERAIAATVDNKEGVPKFGALLKECLPYVQGFREGREWDEAAIDLSLMIEDALESEECELEINIDMTAIRCDKCGYELPKGTDPNKVLFCGGCGR